LVHVHVEDGSIFNTPETSKDFHKHDPKTTQLAIPPVIINKEDSEPNGAELFSSLGCSGCHGQEGKSVNPMFPRLAGLKEDYIISELKNFQTKQRVSPLMYPNAVKAIGFEEDLAKYLSAIK
jgi:cytochrome c553